MEHNEYFDLLNAELERARRVASTARSKGLDPTTKIEIAPGSDVAARVEGLIGLQGIERIIRELEPQCNSREELAYQVIEKVLDLTKDIPKEKRLDYAIRTAVCILTEGVLVAPTEGIAKIKIRQNSDGSDYCAVYFSGPIRSAGGTAMALAIVFADIIRKKLNIGNYRPSDSVISRYAEEIQIYDAQCARLQYKPTEEDIKHIVRNCPICIDGDPTEEVEVSVNRNIDGVETNRVRSGVALVICEGIAQKSAKVLKIAKKFNLDWEWMEKIIKITKKGEKTTLAPIHTFMDEIVAGRPVFSFPMAKGGFRLRYGRTRFTGMMSKAIHPATMLITEEFLAFGTQMKIERPGKGCVVTPCDTIHGPIVLLDNGSVIKIDTYEQAMQVKTKIKKILFLGDILVSFGDFIKTNHPLVPSGWVEEWYAQELKDKGIEIDAEKINSMSYDEAKEISIRNNVPMHPIYTYHWHDITPAQIKMLREEIVKNAKITEDSIIIKCELNSETKTCIEQLCIPHTYSNKSVIIEHGFGLALLDCLGIETLNGSLILKEYNYGGNLVLQIDQQIISEASMKIINELAPYRVMRKVGIYIGARMGRPEKAKEREMEPKIHSLFPVGNNWNSRDAYLLYQELKKEKTLLSVETCNYYCNVCKKPAVFANCDVCGAECNIIYTCKKCGSTGQTEECKCGFTREPFVNHKIDYVKIYEQALKTTKDFSVNEVKGVKGLTSRLKVPERLEKGIIRAFHGVSIFKDGTCRFDCVDVPITHFKVSEINTSIEKLRELGYEKDIFGNTLEKENQIVEIKIQDIIIPENAGDFFLKVSKFVDDLLINLYNLRPYYLCKKREDIIGKLFLGLSPHTSAAILCRVIGFTKARCLLGHPYFHAAKRRNCDGDEDGIMLLLDALINFSKLFLPDSRGGTMDSPLVLINNINPTEIDDEVHAMEICTSYPLELYRKSNELASPIVEKITLVKDVLVDSPYSGFMFTHNVNDITCPLKSSYVTVENMEAKVVKMMELEKKIAAVDARETAMGLINSHFMPDLYGNLRTFAKQKFRCAKCNKSYRRVPLAGKCWDCGGKLLLTVNKGGIEKYLDISKRLIAEFSLPEYINQRIKLIQADIKSIFEDEKKQQESIFDYL